MGIEGEKIYSYRVEPLVCHQGARAVVPGSSFDGGVVGSLLVVFVFPVIKPELKQPKRVEVEET